MARVAKEFSTEKALQKYLHEHPQADKTVHSVKAPAPAGKGATPPPTPQAKKSPPPLPSKKSEHHEEKSKLTDRVKGLSQAAKSFLDTAPRKVQSFVHDAAVRKEALTKAAQSLTAAPKKMVKSLLHTAKEEVHEFKTAAKGVKAVMTGGKMSKEQKHAFKTVATHVAIGAAAAALSAGTAVAASKVFAQGLARHIAAKAVHRSLGRVHVLGEVGHIGHGVVHIMQHLASDQDEETALAHLVMAAVAKELEALDDDDIEQVLNKHADDEKKKTASRILARYLRASV